MAANYRSTTQYHLDVEDVLNNLVLLKDGSCAMVLKTNAINFGLLSEEEQDATIYAYAAFLNSLTFSIQVLIRSSVKDISGYLRLLEEQESRQSNPVKKQQINGYKNFIRSLVTERNVLEKNFYIVIPFSYIELGISQSVATQLFSTTKKLPFDKTYIIEKAQSTLEPRRDHVIRQLERIGLSARQLSSQELIQLLFSMYNPSSSQGQKINNASDYTVPLVQPAYIKPKEDFMSDQTTAPNQPLPQQPQEQAPQNPPQTPEQAAPSLPQQPVPPVATSPTPAMQTAQLAPDPNPTLNQPTTPDPIPGLEPQSPEVPLQNVAPTSPVPTTPAPVSPSPSEQPGISPQLTQPLPNTPSAPTLSPQSTPAMPPSPQAPTTPSSTSPAAPTPPASSTALDPQAAINSAASSLAGAGAMPTVDENNQ